MLSRWNNIVAKWELNLKLFSQIKDGAWSHFLEPFIEWRLYLTIWKEAFFRLLWMKIFSRLFLLEDSCYTISNDNYLYTTWIIIFRLTKVLLAKSLLLTGWGGGAVSLGLWTLYLQRILCPRCFIVFWSMRSK